MNGSYIEFQYEKEYKLSKLEIYMQGFNNLYINGIIQAYNNDTWTNISQETELKCIGESKITKYEIELDNQIATTKYRLFITGGSSANWYGVNVSEIITYAYMKLEGKVVRYPTTVSANDEYPGRVANSAFDGIYTNGAYTNGWQCKDSTLMNGSYIEFQYEKEYKLSKLEIYMQGFNNLYINGIIQVYNNDTWTNISQETELKCIDEAKITKYEIELDNQIATTKYRLFITGGSSANWYGVNVSEIIPYVTY